MRMIIAIALSAILLGCESKDNPAYVKTPTRSLLREPKPSDKLWEIARLEDEKQQRQEWLESLKGNEATLCTWGGGSNDEYSYTFIRKNHDSVEMTLSHNSAYYTVWTFPFVLDDWKDETQKCDLDRIAELPSVKKAIITSAVRKFSNQYVWSR